MSEILVVVGLAGGAIAFWWAMVIPARLLIMSDGYSWKQASQITGDYGDNHPEGPPKWIINPDWEAWCKCGHPRQSLWDRLDRRVTCEGRQR